MSPSPAEVHNRSVSQNNCLNLSFVKELKVIVKKKARNGQKTAIWAGGWRRFPKTTILAILVLRHFGVCRSNDQYNCGETTTITLFQQLTIIILLQKGFHPIVGGKEGEKSVSDEIGGQLFSSS